MFATVRLLEQGVRIPEILICMSLVIIVCCEVEVSTNAETLVQRTPTECGVSECDPGPSYKRPRVGKAV